MFSYNGKISEKQLRRMLVASTFAGSIFVLPYLSARLFGESVCTGLIVFFVLAVIYTGCIYGLEAVCRKRLQTGKSVEGDGRAEAGENAGGDGRAKAGKNAAQDGRTKAGENTAEGNKVEAGFEGLLYGSGLWGKSLAVIQTVRVVLRLAFYIILSIKILGEAQVPFMQKGNSDRISNLFVALPLLLVALYGAAQGRKDLDWKKKANEKEPAKGTAVEKQGRLHEMIFWVLFVPFIIMLLFGLKEADYSVFVPRLQMPVGTLLLYSYALLTFILPVDNYLYLRPAMKKGKSGLSFGAVALTVLLAAVLSLFMLGIYGIHGGGSEEMLTIAIMRYIRLPLGVLERFDVLMVWFFMTGCFLLICSALYRAGNLLGILFGRVRRLWLLTGALIIAVVTVFLLPEYNQSLTLFLCWGVFFDIPLSLLVPLLSLGIPKKYLKLLPVLALCLLTGCGAEDKNSVNDMKNVEQRGYATILLVSPGENGKRYHFDLGIAEEKRAGEDSQTEEVCGFDCGSFEELSEKFQSVKGKDLSLAHLKVILIEDAKDGSAEREEQGQLLYDMDDNEEIAKTCPVLQLEDRKEFLDYLEEAKEPAGTYLSDLVEAGQRQGKDIPWLKDYLKAVREGDSIFIYALEQTEEGWTIKCRDEMQESGTLQKAGE